MKEVIVRRGPDEDGSLGRAPHGPVRCVIGLSIDGEALFHVPAMTAVQLELTLLNHPSREALEALVAAIEAALAAPEADEP